MFLFSKQVKVYKVYKRYHGYAGRTHDEFVIETVSEKAAQEIADNLTKNGIAKDGRINFDGVVK
jgi:NADH/NAD ratio-sensing transcriptional regulator Rex